MRAEIRSHERLARLAAQQHGIVTRRQLRALGYSDAAITRAAQAARLHPVQRGVFAVGHRGVTLHGRCLAAVAACGADAALSHSSAAWLWGLIPTCALPPEVCVPRSGHARPDIRVHHTPTLAADDRQEHEGVPTVTVAVVLLQLAASGSAGRLERTIERAERLGRLDLIELDAVLRRRAGCRGAARLRRAAELYREPAFHRARSELLFLNLIKKARLPRPALNTFVAGYEIDAYWEAERFAVEVDGWDSHRTRAAFERDPLRQENLKLAGIDSIRITARRIEREPEAVAASLAALLDKRRQGLAAQ